MFEGLGLGTRIALMPLPQKLWSFGIGLAIVYSLSTPIGVAAGLGAIQSYNGDSAASNILTGTVDSIAAGILLYTGLVQLLAREFIFTSTYHQLPLWRACFAIGLTMTGAGIMALLGRWA